MRVLVVEDDADLSRQLKALLTEAGYAVDTAPDGEEGHFLGDTEPYDAVVLDLGLPVIDGVTVLKRWRRAGRNMPVLILTARDRWSEKVAGFDAGADDYVTKPFQVEEVLARIRALIRRAAGHSSGELECGGLQINSGSGRVTVDGDPVKLTAQEFRLLDYLMHHKGKIVSRTELTEHIYDQDFDRNSNTIEVFAAACARRWATTTSRPGAALATNCRRRAMRRRTGSLALRLILAAGAWIAVALLAVGLMLSAIFRDYVVRSFDARLNALMDSLIAVVEVAPDGIRTSRGRWASRASIRPIQAGIGRLKVFLRTRRCNRVLSGIRVSPSAMSRARMSPRATSSVRRKRRCGWPSARCRCPAARDAM